MTSIRLIVLVVVAVQTVLAGDHAQLRAKVEGVRLVARVLDRHGAVIGLTKADLELRDNGVPQDITIKAVADHSLDVRLVLDVSDSLLVDRRLAAVKDAALTLVSALSATDRLTLISFASRPVIHASGDPSRLRQSIVALSAGGGTSLYDAVYAAAVLEESSETPALVLLASDGRDNSSWLSAEDAAAAVRASTVVMYAVGFRRAQDTPVSLQPSWADVARVPDDALLRTLTQAGGGEVFYAGDTADLSRAFIRVIDQLRTAYIVTYSPAGVPQQGMHRIEMKLRGRPGRVVARAGYSAN